MRPGQDRSLNPALTACLDPWSEWYVGSTYLCASVSHQCIMYAANVDLARACGTVRVRICTMRLTPVQHVLQVVDAGPARGSQPDTQITERTLRLADEDA